MHIESMQARRLMALSAVELADLPTGLVVISGGTGAGKTTLLHALGPAPLLGRLPGRGALPQWWPGAELEVTVGSERWSMQVTDGGIERRGVPPLPSAALMAAHFHAGGTALTDTPPALLFRRLVELLQGEPVWARAEEARRALATIEAEQRRQAEAAADLEAAITHAMTAAAERRRLAAEQAALEEQLAELDTRLAALRTQRQELAEQHRAAEQLGEIPDIPALREELQRCQARRDEAASLRQRADRIEAELSTRSTASGMRADEARAELEQAGQRYERLRQDVEHIQAKEQAAARAPCRGDRLWRLPHQATQGHVSSSTARLAGEQVDCSECPLLVEAREISKRRRDTQDELREADQARERAAGILREAQRGESLAPLRAELEQLHAALADLGEVDVQIAAVRERLRAASALAADLPPDLSPGRLQEMQVRLAHMAEEIASAQQQREDLAGRRAATAADLEEQPRPSDPAALRPRLERIRRGREALADQAARARARARALQPSVVPTEILLDQLESLNAALGELLDRAGAGFLAAVEYSAGGAGPAAHVRCLLESGQRIAPAGLSGSQLALLEELLRWALGRHSPYPLPQWRDELDQRLGPYLPHMPALIRRELDRRPGSQAVIVSNHTGLLTVADAVVEVSDGHARRR